MTEANSSKVKQLPERNRQVVLEDLGRFAFKEVDVPSPAPGEVLIRISRIGICGSDISAYYGRHPYIHCPVVLGHEFSGTIAGIGDDVGNLHIGDRCTVIPHLVCGECPACKSGRFNLCGKLRVPGAQADGAFGDYICMPADMVVSVPNNVPMEQAALVEPAAVGYHAARKGNPQPDEIALIFGAGPIGMFTMQAIKALGVKKVIIADKDAARLDLAKKLGVDGCIDISEGRTDDILDELVDGGDKIDVFYDCVGFGGQALNEIIRIARRGVRVVVAGVLESGCIVPLLPDFVEHELTLTGSTMYVPSDFRDVLDLMAVGHIRVDGMISHRASLMDVEDIYRMIDARQEPFYKIILEVD
ncbi:MAG: zinc-dependent alcohol dehydrogenase [Armatimonadota bacterium]